MGSEEVLSVRAGLHPRAKRRGHDRVNLRLSGRNFIESGGNGGSDGWLGATQTPRVTGQHHASSRAPIHKKSTSHGGIEPHNNHCNRQHQRSSSAVPASVARYSADNQAPSRAGGGGGGGGGGSIGVGGMGGGDGSVGHAVHAAAVESVEVFLGDFVPKVIQPPAVAALLSSPAAAAGGEEKSAGAGQAGVGGAVAKTLSKWAAIGRGGKISARATAVCIEEVRVQSFRRFS